MQVKIFQASGHDGIEKLEEEINGWSDTQKWAHTQRSIKFIETAMCQIGNAKVGERFQSYVVSVWYT